MANLLQDEIAERLLAAAIRVMHHDIEDGNEVHDWEKRTLLGEIKSILSEKPKWERGMKRATLRRCSKPSKSLKGKQHGSEA